MCGILGIIGKNVNKIDALSSIVPALKKIEHRGPDALNYTFIENGSSNSIYFGHVRLTIIDLTGGAQPMMNEKKTICLTFNGEIYNYIEIKNYLTSKGIRFKESSDTEVLLKAYEYWGENCVKEFRGMFAFAIWDSLEQKLFIARDQFGKKPLFYYSKDGLFAFASEIKALLALPGVSSTFNENALSNYLHYRYVPGPSTLFSGIEKLQPGHTLVWHKNKISFSRYYEVPDSSRILPESRKSESSLINEFLEILGESVSIRM